MNFSDKVKYARAKLGCSQHAFADAMDVSCASISNWENAIREPRLSSKIRFYSVCAANGIQFADVPGSLLVDFISGKESGFGKKRGRKRGYKSQDETRIHGY